MTREGLQGLAKQYGSFYLYDENMIEEATSQLLHDFKGIQFL